jgi:hypothetical protein
MDARAGRACRLLIRLFPPGPRRSELLDTLSQSSRAGGRIRLGPAAAADLLVHGLRARLGRPASRSVVLVAVLVSVFAGTYTAAFADRAAWHVGVRDLPDAAALAQIRQALTPDVVPSREFAGTAVFATDSEGIYPASSGYRGANTSRTADQAAYREELLRRLSADGWRVVSANDPAESPGRLAISAVRDHWVISVGIDADASYINPDPATLRETVQVDVVRTTPGWVTAAAVAGFAAGMVLGWFLTGWASRRTEAGRAAGLRVAALTWVMVIFFAPGVLVGLGQFADQVAGAGHPGLFWQYMMYDNELALFPILATTAGVLALADTLRSTPRRPARRGA